MKRLWYFILLLITCFFVTTIVRAEEQQEQAAEKNKLISIGGQVRFRYDVTSYQSLDDFSYDPHKRESQLLNRTRIHIESNPAEWVRLYFEPQFYGRWGGYDNEDRLSLYQGYIEFPKLGTLPVGLKIGRQDFVYGSAFFLANDDWYRGLAWDGVKVMVKPLSAWSVDLIGARLVSFTNNKADKTGLYGFYSTYTGIKNTDWDIYFFYNRHGFQHLYGHLHESPQWFTAGTRLALTMYERLHFELEPMYQFGRVRNDERGGDDQIRAYGGHVDLSYDFALPLEPNLKVSYAFGTGDSNTKDNVMREFHGNIYNDTLLVGDMSLVPDVSGIDIGDIRASGLKVVTVSSSVKHSPKLSASLDYHHFTADKTPAGYTKTLGSEADLYIGYELTEKINILASANCFFTADIFREATGKKKDVDYFYRSI
ncbi:MAG: alginate export family protein [Proteobacteria bacterium]|nr:alginate export family protein [Pseudomonadota bacterium]